MKRAKLEALRQQLEREKEKEKERLRLDLENKAKQEMIDYILWGSKKSKFTTFLFIFLIESS
jgi:hypothetical protein